MKMHHLKICLLYLLLASVAVACKKDQSKIGDNAVSGNQKSNLTGGGFEISYWIDIDLRSNNGRGYWFHVADRSADSVPTSAQIWGAASRCRYTYHGLTLYVIYHRQFEIAAAKAAFRSWKTHASSMGLYSGSGFGA